MDHINSVDLFLTLVIGFLLRHLVGKPELSFTFAPTIDEPPQVVTVIKYFNTTIREGIEHQTRVDTSGLSLSTFFICLLSFLIFTLLVALYASHADTCHLAIDLVHDEIFGLFSLDSTLTGNDSHGFNSIYLSTSTSTHDLPRNFSNVKDAGTMTEPYVSSLGNMHSMDALELPPPPPLPTSKSDVATTPTGQIVVHIPQFSRTATGPPPPSSSFTFDFGVTAPSFGAGLSSGIDHVATALSAANSFCPPGFGTYTTREPQISDASMSPYSGVITGGALEKRGEEERAEDDREDVPEAGSSAAQPQESLKKKNKLSQRQRASLRRQREAAEAAGKQE